MLEFITHFIIEFVKDSSYLGIFILMLLESALIPIPSEVTMGFSGFLVSEGAMNFWLVVFVGTVANLVGSIIAYYIGFFLEETVIIGLIKKYGKFILVSEKEYKHAKSWFEKYGDKIIFISRLLPGIRTIISLPAGVFEMNFKKFVIYTVAGCFLWSTLLTYLGFVMGANWTTLEVYYRKFEFLVIGFLVIIIALFIYKKFELGSKFKKAKKG